MTQERSLCYRQAKNIENDVFYTVVAPICVASIHNLYISIDVTWPKVPMKDIPYLQPLCAVGIRVSLNLARYKQLCGGRCNLLCAGDKLLL
jgi:hypothetical protein